MFRHGRRSLVRAAVLLSFLGCIVFDGVGFVCPPQARSVSTAAAPLLGLVLAPAAAIAGEPVPVPTEQIDTITGAASNAQPPNAMPEGIVNILVPATFIITVAVTVGILILSGGNEDEKASEW